MTLEDLRQKAFFQNTIDVWIAYSEERGWDWYNIDAYRCFIGHLISKGIKMQTFPLCFKDSGRTYDRRKNKRQFLHHLSKISAEDAAAYSVKVTAETIGAIRLLVN